jgi:hypothetical protein
VREIDDKYSKDPDFVGKNIARENIISAKMEIENETKQEFQEQNQPFLIPKESLPQPTQV